LSWPIFVRFASFVVNPARYRRRPRIDPSIPRMISRAIPDPTERAALRAADSRMPS
jgi:hypothetical protein